MKIAISKYHLFPAKEGQSPPREGALFRILQNNGIFGYADCHPWPELGDPSLETQLKLITEGKLTQLTKQTLKFAKMDAQAREEGRNLFQGMELPRNHYLVVDQRIFSEKLLDRLHEEGIRAIKIKASLNLNETCCFFDQFSVKLHQNFQKVRVDFNCKLDGKQFSTFLKRCSAHLEAVDFFEDPFPYDPIRWQEMRENQNIKLACDRDSVKALAFPQSCDFLVVKPAIQEVDQFLKKDLEGRRLVLTSYLDHPLGQLSALYTAAEVMKKHPGILSECGFLSHHAYGPTPFSLALKQQGPRLIPLTEGEGFGYDLLLQGLNWTVLA